MNTSFKATGCNNNRTGTTQTVDVKFVYWGSNVPMSTRVEYDAPKAALIWPCVLTVFNDLNLIVF